jgi:hypothetical protein
MRRESRGTKYKDLVWSSKLGVGCKADDLALQKENIVAKPKGVKTGWYNSRPV